jgi:hypothetical protein
MLKHVLNLTNLEISRRTIPPETYTELKKPTPCYAVLEFGLNHSCFFLQPGYLGTDPTLFSAPPDTRTVNYDETDQEFANLNKTIKAHQTSGKNIL